MVAPISSATESALIGIELSYKVFAKAIIFATSAGSQYRNARFGPAGTLFYVTGLVDTDRLQQMHWNINVWTEEEVIAWRDSYVATCNSIPVAGAVFATLGLTALLLPDMYNVHWSARALCITSMLLGVLSVATATSQQQAIAMLNNSVSIRLWLSRGRPKPYGSIPASLRAPHTKTEIQSLGWLSTLLVLWRERKALNPNARVDWPELMRESVHKQQEQHDAAFRTGWREQDKYKGLPPFDGLPLESSVAALRAVAAPKLLLNMAVLVFIVGIGLYLLFQWVEHMGGQPISNRNIFIVFIMSVGIFVIYHLFILSNIIVSQDKKGKEFNLQELGKFHKSQALKELEKELEDVQKRLKIPAEQNALPEIQNGAFMRQSSETRNSNGGGSALKNV